MARALFRDHPVHQAEDLRVRNDQVGQAGKACQGCLQGIRRTAVRHASPVQQLPQHLHLRQDEAALRRLRILRHHQQDVAARVHEAAGQVFLLLPGCRGNQALQQGRDALAAGIPDHRNPRQRRQCPEIRDIDRIFPHILLPMLV